MPYIVICQKQDGSIEVAAHPGEATPEMLQDAQPAASVDEAMQLAKAVLGEGSGAPEDESAEGQPAEDMERNAGNDAPADEEYGAAAPSGAEGMPMKNDDDAMEAGYRRAKKGY